MGRGTKINVGTAKIALGFTPKEMWDLFDSLGFGQAPNLGFPGEVNGRLRPWKNWRPIEQATMSYGHGIAVSLIGRNHPVGIVLAALLFGALFQGGAELAFEIPGFSRDMVTTLQGLIVLFSGAMAQVAAPALARVHGWLRPARVAEAPHG